LAVAAERAITDWAESKEPANLEATMLKILLLSTALVGLLIPDVCAEMYKCRTPEGKTVITDRKIVLSDDCQLIHETSEANTFTNVPETSGSAASESSPDMPQGGTPDSSAWQQQATALEESYQEAVRRRYHASYASEKREAIQQIEQLRAQKGQMLEDLSRSGLTPAEQDAIRSILEVIPKR